VKIDKKIRCVHCNNELIIDSLIENAQCQCGAIVVTNGLITEGTHGSDWVDISPILLNE